MKKKLEIITKEDKFNNESFLDFVFRIALEYCWS